MEALDKKIREVFYNVLKYGEFVNRSFECFNFKLNGIEVTIKVKGKSEHDKTTNEFPKLEVDSADYTWMCSGIITQLYSCHLGNESGRSFYITINGHDYILTDVTRKEDADIMDRLESIIQKHELDIIDSLL